MNVSVVIPTYNQSRLLKRTLLCLKHQTVSSTNFEVIVCDDGSGDDTMSVVCSFEQHMDIRYCYQPDKGFRAGTARNMGIRLAKYELCLFLDTGVIVADNCIERVSQFHKTYDNTANIGVVYGMRSKNKNPSMLRVLEQVANSDRPEKSMNNKMLAVYLDARQPMYNACKHNISALPTPWSLFWTCMASVRTQTLRDVGLFDESFVGWGHEDVELGYRLWEAGVGFRSDPAVCALHLPHDKFEPTHATSELNVFRFYKKHPTLPVEVKLICSQLQWGLEETLDPLLAARSRLPLQYDIDISDIPTSKDGVFMLVGCMSSAFATALHANEVLTVSRDVAEELRDLGIRAAYRIGMNHFCDDNSYNTVLVTDVWKIIPRGFVSIFFDEMLRIANHVVFVDHQTVESTNTDIVYDRYDVHTITRKNDLSILQLARRTIL